MIITDTDINCILTFSRLNEYHKLLEISYLGIIIKKMADWTCNRVKLGRLCRF